MSENNCETKYFPDGRISDKVWRNDKHEIHRLDDPARISWVYNNGYTMKYEYWYLNGKLYRENGPAEIRYRDGELFAEEWFPRRTDGPSLIYYDERRITNMTWYDDKNITRKDQDLIDKENNLFKCIWYDERETPIREEIICEDLVKSSI